MPCSQIHSHGFGAMSYLCQAEMRLLVPQLVLQIHFSLAHEECLRCLHDQLIPEP
jgi:hypothetical protein